MDKQSLLKKAVYFFITKIIVGIVTIGALVALLEWMGRLLLDKTAATEATKMIIIAILQCCVTVIGYRYLFKFYEKRKVNELSVTAFGSNAVAGIVIGLALQSLFIIVISLAGTYSILRVNPFSGLVVPFAFAITAGFVAEILLIGVLFRLIEEQAGTTITLTIFVVLFALMHLNAKGASWLSVAATAVQAGFLLPAAYVFSRSLWLPVFIHFSWDFAEPGIFGAINPSTSITEGLLTSTMTGADYITGGQTGPQNSIQSLILCVITGGLFLFFAKRKGKFLKPKWVL